MNWLEWLAVVFNAGWVIGLCVLGYWAYATPRRKK